jgi:hypothetical protein
MISVSRAVKYVEAIVKYDFNIIPVLMGNPGISKTAQLHQMCQRNKWGLLPIHLALRPIESLSGLPDIVKKGEDKLGTIWSEPEVVYFANKLAQKYDKVVLFFDDIHLADKSRQSYFFELATERAIQGHRLADNVKIVCAGNLTTKAGAKTFLSAIVNRFSFIEVGITKDEWINWVMKGENKRESFSINKDVDKEILEMRIHPIILGFINQYPEKLTQPEDVRPFASPRSWYIMSEWLKLFELIYGPSNKWNREIVNDLTTIASGTVGQTTAADLVTFIRYTSDIDIDALTKDPIKMLEISDREKRIAVYYTLLTRYTIPKYKKYALRFLDVAYYDLGNSGKSLHFVVNASIYISVLDIITNFDKYEESYRIKDEAQLKKIISQVKRRLDSLAL